MASADFVKPAATRMFVCAPAVLAVAAAHHDDEPLTVSRRGGSSAAHATALGPGRGLLHHPICPSFSPPQHQIVHRCRCAHAKGPVRPLPRLRGARPLAHIDMPAVGHAILRLPRTAPCHAQPSHATPSPASLATLPYPQPAAALPRRAALDLGPLWRPP